MRQLGALPTGDRDDRRPEARRHKRFIEKLIEGLDLLYNLSNTFVVSAQLRLQPSSREN